MRLLFNGTKHKTQSMDEKYLECEQCDNRFILHSWDFINCQLFARKIVDELEHHNGNEEDVVASSFGRRSCNWIERSSILRILDGIKSRLPNSKKQTK